jgi:hypothetical protein
MLGKSRENTLQVALEIILATSRESSKILLFPGHACAHPPTLDVVSSDHE